MKMNLVFMCVLLFFSCKNRNIKYIKPYLGNTKVLTLPYGAIDMKYYINDTISSLYVSHHECTECLDAEVDSGIVFMPDSVAQKILDFYKERNFVPVNGRDLLLIGKDKVDEKLFGNQDNFMSKWHDRYLIKGKVIDMSLSGGLLFYVNDYKITYDE